MSFQLPCRKETCKSSLKYYTVVIGAVRWTEGVLKCIFILTFPCEKGLDSMVTCRTGRQWKSLPTSSSESQQALKGNWVSQPVGPKVSLPFTSSTKLAFNTYVLFVVPFEPLFVKSGVSTCYLNIPFLQRCLVEKGTLGMAAAWRRGPASCCGFDRFWTDS